MPDEAVTASTSSLRARSIEEDASDVSSEHSSVHSVASEKMCKFCYSSETVGTWLHPCRCAGSMKWVHYDCFSYWLAKAPTHQQIQCLTCKYVYRKFYVLKPFAEWCRPPLQLSCWEVIEIALDAVSTVKFFRGLLNTLLGKRSIFIQFAHAFFWRMFVATDRRLMYYANLGRTLASSVFNISVQDYNGEIVNDKEEDGSKMDDQLM